MQINGVENGSYVLPPNRPASTLSMLQFSNANPVTPRQLTPCMTIPVVVCGTVSLNIINSLFALALAPALSWCAVAAGYLSAAAES
jgi:hypothetical protein